MTLDITDADTPEKARRMVGRVAAADYLILSSGRQSEVMPRLPGRFPMTARWYAMLASGEACLRPAWSFDRGFPLPAMRIDDAWAQEPWRVYDHPIVRIYEKTSCFDADKLSTRLIDSLAAKAIDGTTSQ